MIRRAPLVFALTMFGCSKAPTMPPGLSVRVLQVTTPASIKTGSPIDPSETRPGSGSKFVVVDVEITYSRCEDTQDDLVAMMASGGSAAARPKPQAQPAGSPPKATMAMIATKLVTLVLADGNKHQAIGVAEDMNSCVHCDRMLILPCDPNTGAAPKKQPFVFEIPAAANTAGARVEFRNASAPIS